MAQDDTQRLFVGGGGSGGGRTALESPVSPAYSGRQAGRSGGAALFALLPLRIFLGVTFGYAGIDKLTDGSFLSASGAGSIGDTMHAVRDSSAIPAMVDLALKSPVDFGYAMAFGELAVGLGVLFGVLTRVAATGGALISLSLWLTMSWAVTPYYYGNDLPYLMAWLPLVIAGAPQLSLDALVRAARRRRTADLPQP